MAKRSRKESNSSEDEGGGEQEEKEEGEASDEENEWTMYCAKEDIESTKKIRESTHTGYFENKTWNTKLEVSNWEMHCCWNS